MTVYALESPAESRKTAFVGMVMALASWAMLFASLFFSYAMVRLRSPGWPPEGTAPLPVFLPAVATLVLLASSAVFPLFARHADRPGTLLRALLASSGLGALFLALQLVVWVALWRTGFVISSGGAYGSVFYGLTALHALHVLAGLVALLCLVPRARRDPLASFEGSAVRNTILFWHFVDAVWVLMFVAVYLV